MGYLHQAVPEGAWACVLALLHHVSLKGNRSLPVTKSFDIYIHTYIYVYTYMCIYTFFLFGGGGRVSCVQFSQELSLLLKMAMNS